ncbi:MAG: hypothetical protein ACXW25_10780 [Rhodospirillales bacterium]
MSGKRVLWRDRCDERLRARRRRQGRVMAALAQVGADGREAAADDVAAPQFDLSSWLMLVPAGEGTPANEARVLEP